MARKNLIRAEALDFIAHEAARLLAPHGISPDDSKRLGGDLVSKFMDFFAGQVISFPSKATQQQEYRDALIWAEFDGTNCGELASKLGMTERGVQKALERIRLRRREPSTERP